MEGELAMSYGLCLVLMLTGTCAHTFGADPSSYAHQEDLWNGTGAVIGARVREVRHLEGFPATYYVADLEPLVCVAGLFNPAATPQLTIEFTAGGMSALRVPPVANDLVVAVIFDRGKLLIRPLFI
jgi:hypothetical protein